jgi:indolepyruvate decarboxylase
MPTVSDFLLERIQNVGVKHVFGVPGEYILSLYKKINDSEIRLINSTDENHAGFSADAYSRTNGVGCVCVTYNVGALKIINAVTCSYAERCPVIVISGSPGIKERSTSLHQFTKNFDYQKNIFDQITCASVILDDPSTAGFKIDEAINKLQYFKQPIYIELPRDIADQSISYDVYKQGTPKKYVSDIENLNESIKESENIINDSKNPVILAGVQLSRYKLESNLIKFAEKNNLPICTTLLSKSVVQENHSLFKGVYMGSCTDIEVKDLIEQSDCLLMFGVLLSDLSLGFSLSKFDKRQVISASIEGIKIKNHIYEDILFSDFCDNIFKLELQNKPKDITINRSKLNDYFIPSKEKLTTPRLFEKINSVLQENMVVVADVGESLFGSIDLEIREKNRYVCSSFYTSMGYSIPAAIATQLADPKIRPIVIVGDGSFQMCCSELTNAIRNNLNPIIIVINNGGYASERKILDGSFNDLLNWNYHEITNLIGGGVGVEVSNEEQFDLEIQNALKSEQLYVINAIVDSDVVSFGLERILQGLNK